MKTIAKLVCCLYMMPFLVFVWLSHSGVLPGSALAHGWGGFGLFVLAVFAWILLLQTSKDGSHKMANVFSFFYCILLIFNAIIYIFLRVANLIGPAYTSDDGAVLVGIFYCLLAIVGAFLMDAAIKDELV